MIRIALDYDGVVSANYQHYFQLASDFKRSGHQVYIITAAEHERGIQIIDNLSKLCFPYSGAFIRDANFVSTHKNIGEWKKKTLINNKIDLWFDNEVKIYEQAGVDFSDIKTEIVRV